MKNAVGSRNERPHLPQTVMKLDDMIIVHSEHGLILTAIKLSIKITSVVCQEDNDQ